MVVSVFKILAIAESNSAVNVLRRKLFSAANSGELKKVTKQLLQKNPDLAAKLPDLYQYTPILNLEKMNKAALCFKANHIREAEEIAAKRGRKFVANM